MMELSPCVDNSILVRSGQVVDEMDMDKAKLCCTKWNTQSSWSKNAAW